jgi:hypothetical protein
MVSSPAKPREPLDKSMIGIQAFEAANYFVAKLGNIPDIPCVLRLVIDCLRNLSARPGLIQRFPSHNLKFIYWCALLSS